MARDDDQEYFSHRHFYLSGQPSRLIECTGILTSKIRRCLRRSSTSMLSYPEIAGDLENQECGPEKNCSRVSRQSFRSPSLRLFSRARPALKTALDESPSFTRLSRSCRG